MTDSATPSISGSSSGLRRHPRVLVAGHFGHRNAGDELILQAMVQGLRAGRADLEIVVLAGSPAEVAALPAPAAIREADLQGIAQAIRDSDLVLIGGGGHFQDYWQPSPSDVLRPGSGGLPFFLGLAVLACAMRKPLALYSVGVGPLVTTEGQRMTGAVCDLAQSITVRDDYSLRALEQLELLPATRSRIEVAADPVFALAPSPGSAFEPARRRMGLAPGARYHAAALRHWSFGINTEVFESAVAAGLDQFMRSHDEPLVFLPFHQGHTNYEDDVAAHRRILERCQTAERLVLVEQMPVEELTAAVQGAQSILAMRLHAFAVAASAGVPCLALAYDPKVRALAERLGLADFCLELPLATAEAIGSGLSRAVAERPAADSQRLAELRALAARSAEAAGECLERPAPATALPPLVGEILASRSLDIVELSYRLDILARQVEAQRERFEILKGEQEQARIAHEEVSRLLEQRRKGTAERQLLRDQRDIALAQRHDLARRLAALEETLGLRAVQTYWRSANFLFPEGSRRHRFYRGFHRVISRALTRTGIEIAKAARDGAAAAGPDFRRELARFAEQAHLKNSDPVAVIVSATQLIESEGQRATHLALELAGRGVPVVFLYWRWWPHEWQPQDRLEQGIFQLPIDIAAEAPEAVLEQFASDKRLLMVEFPHPTLFGLVAEANARGWITVYDVVDDWEEFGRVGQAVWYDRSFEQHLLHAADAVLAINPNLASRIAAMGVPDAIIVPNGVRTSIAIVSEPRPLVRGEITVGYFGYLAGAWFDWDLLAAAARSRPAWRFYLIGYGGPRDVKLPENIRLLGKQPQSELAAYAANWDVAIVPFKRERLAAGADPIKTYEYLAMGLPVVTTGVPPPVDGHGLVLEAVGVDDFVAAIERACGRDMRAARAFVRHSTWAMRVDKILDAVSGGEQRVAEKRALFSLPT
jgi:polysaccharide pyruvyl transferase CsaB